MEEPEIHSERNCIRRLRPGEQQLFMLKVARVWTLDCRTLNADLQVRADHSSYSNQFLGDGVTLCRAIVNGQALAPSARSHL